MKKLLLIYFSIVIVFVCYSRSQSNVNVTSNDEVLPSWNEGATKNAIIEFVTRVTKEGSADFIPIPDRIACFDNDGTLWCEQPMYFQFMFAIDRVKEMAPQHPEWKRKQPFKSILKGDVKEALSRGKIAILKILKATQTGMSDEEFAQQVSTWMQTAQHPTLKRPYNKLTYQPMIELMEYLRSYNFKTFIVTGGEEGFMCPWVQEAYGIPCEQVVGTLLKSKYEVDNGTSYIKREAKIELVNDGHGKPVGIYNQIGKRPVFTVGNSDGDYEMLQWTMTDTGYPRFGMIVHHTDSIREFAYDRHSEIGKLERGLDDAGKYKWVIVDMKNDWKEIFVK